LTPTAFYSRLEISQNGNFLAMNLDIGKYSCYNAYVPLICIKISMQGITAKILDVANYNWSKYLSKSQALFVPRRIRDSVSSQWENNYKSLKISAIERQYPQKYRINFLNYHPDKLEVVKENYYSINYSEKLPLEKTITVKDVLYVPRYQAFYDLRDGSRINTSKMPWIPKSEQDSQEFESLYHQSIDTTKIKKIDQKFMYGENITLHYGHFLCETISRLWYLEQAEKLGILVIGQPHKAKSISDLKVSRNFVDEFMTALDLDSEQFLELTRPVILGEVVFPYPSLSLHRREVFSCHKLVPELVAQKLLPDKVTQTEQPLYISRTKLKKANRQILGEEQLENILRERGFAIIYSENLTLQEKIYLVNKHKYIVGPWASSLHTIIFSLSDSKNIFCLSDKGNLLPVFAQFDALKSVNSTYIAAIQSEGEDDNHIMGQKILDVDAALSGLKESNLL